MPACVVVCSKLNIPGFLRLSLKRETSLAAAIYIIGNLWFSQKLAPDTLIPITLLGEPWVLFRDANGVAGCLRDECAHRACPLSLGSIDNGQVVCPYHGWQYDTTGSCNHMPSTVQCKGVSVVSLPVSEQDGFVWVWPGNGIPTQVG